jgi:hypothetical protein
MSIKLEVTGQLGKDPYVQTIDDLQVTILSMACRSSTGLCAPIWVMGSIWEPRVGIFVQETFKKGDTITAFGTISKLGVYYNSEGKAKPGLDMFINAIGTKERV